MATKKYNLSIVVLAVLALSVVQLPSVYAVDSPADAKQVFVFLRDVVGLDVEKYEPTLTTFFTRDYTNDANPIGNLGYIETSGQYTMHYWDTVKETYSALDVTFSFANATLISCSLSVISGLPLYSKPLPSNLAEASEDFLQRYQAFSGDPELNAMKNMIDNADLTKNTTLTAGNLKLKSLSDSNSVSMQWTKTQNGVDYSSLNLEFKNGSFLSFYDSRSYYRIGNTDVNISEEQAVDIALKQADGFSYSYNGKLVNNLTIVKEQIRAELKANVRYNPSEYYPCWIVDLPLNDVYPGFIYYIEVLLWADTGEVISCKEMGYGGPLPNDDPNDSTPTDSAPTATSTPENVTPTQIENSTLPPSTIIIAVIVAAVLIPTLIAAIVLKKKKSK